MMKRKKKEKISRINQENQTAKKNESLSMILTQTAAQVVQVVGHHIGLNLIHQSKFAIVVKQFNIFLGLLSSKTIPKISISLVYLDLDLWIVFVIAKFQRTDLVL